MNTSLFSWFYYEILENKLSTFFIPHHILQLRGVRPFFSDKFDITKHPKYKYLSDADPKNAFDMEKHLRRRPAIVKPDEVFDYYEIDAADLQEDADNE